MISQDIATLVSNGLGVNWELGSNIFVGFEKPTQGDDIPTKAIFVTGTGGFAAEALKDGSQLATITAQIIIRHLPSHWIEGETLANQVLDILDLKPPANYIEISARTSRASPLPPNDQGSPRWVINVDIRIHETQ